MPLSTLACPPNQTYISQFTKNEGKYINNTMNNTFTNLTKWFYEKVNLMFFSIPCS